jgi:putative ABC transport system permease protein
VNLLQTFKVALMALRRNKLRSFLTTLGMVIGVGAVIAMVAIGEGATAKVEAQFAAMGANLLLIVPGSTQTGGQRGGAGTQATLTWDDLRAIRDELSSVKLASPMIRLGASTMSEQQNWFTQIYGVSPEYFDLRNWKVTSGAPFTQGDLDGRTKVAILGKTVADKLFYGEDPYGQTVRIRSVPFQVVGVLEPKGQSTFGTDYDDAVLVPSTTLQSKLQGGLKNVINGVIFASAYSQEGARRASKEIGSLLRDRHHIQPGAEDDFTINNLTEMANAQQQDKQTMLMMLAAVALISLLVGGIGIMNIMLVSVTERTREIGLRMAIGATPAQILLQFLVEALTLSVIGGLIGVGVGIGAAWWIAQKIDWPLLIRPDAAVIAVGFSAAVGLLFGIYPSQRAARLDPIEALRHE